MKKTIALLTAFVGVFIYGIALGAPSQAQGPNVTVVNTPSNPIPVSGGVNVVGGVNVTVTNDTVPVQKCARFTINDGSLDYIASIYTVPQGQRLTVEYFSCKAGPPAGQKMMFSVQTVMNDGAVQHFLPITPAALSEPREWNVSAGQQVRAYADPGTNVDAYALRSGGFDRDAFVDCCFTGYLQSIQ